MTAALTPEEREAIARRHAAEDCSLRGRESRGEDARAVHADAHLDRGTLLAALTTAERERGEAIDDLATAEAWCGMAMGKVSYDARRYGEMIDAEVANRAAAEAGRDAARATVLALVEQLDAALAALSLARTAAASAALRIGQVEAERDEARTAASNMHAMLGRGVELFEGDAERLEAIEAQHVRMRAALMLVPSATPEQIAHHVECLAADAKEGHRDLASGYMVATSRAERLERALVDAAEALDFYADPETYFAIGFFPDRPCGPFIDDFDDTELGRKPGVRARRALEALAGLGAALAEQGATTQPGGEAKE